MRRIALREGRLLLRVTMGSKAGQAEKFGLPIRAWLVDFPARLVQITVQCTTLFVGQALWAFLPLEAFRPGCIPLALRTALVTVRLPPWFLCRTQFTPLPSHRRPGLQGSPCQKNYQPEFHVPRPIAVCHA